MWVSDSLFIAITIDTLLYLTLASSTRQLCERPTVDLSFKAPVILYLFADKLCGPFLQSISNLVHHVTLSCFIYFDLSLFEYLFCLLGMSFMVHGLTNAFFFPSHLWILYSFFRIRNDRFLCTTRRKHSTVHKLAVHGLEADEELGHQLKAAPVDQKICLNGIEKHNGYFGPLSGCQSKYQWPANRVKNVDRHITLAFYNAMPWPTFWVLHGFYFLPRSPMKAITHQLNPLQTYQKY